MAEKVEPKKLGKKSASEFLKRTKAMAMASNEGRGNSKVLSRLVDLRKKLRQAA